MQSLKFKFNNNNKKKKKKKQLFNFFFLFIYKLKNKIGFFFLLMGFGICNNSINEEYSEGMPKDSSNIHLQRYN